jgi:3-isopropylmalate/(R)-2-methylmalate dehydratase large subunit
MSGKSLFDKVWDEHIVVPEGPDNPAVLYIDLHLIHEVTTPQAFTVLRDRGLPVRRPDLTLATMDHSTPTVPVATLEDLDVVCEPDRAAQIRAMVDNCRHFGIELHGFGSEHRGKRRPRTMAVNFEGRLQTGVSAKDMILALIGQIGVDGGTGHVIEYRGSTLGDLNMEQRMTICNMSIEAGARAGMMAPDDVTIEYLAGRPRAPSGAGWDEAVARWRSLPSDPDANFDKEVTLDVSGLAPMVTFGTNPGMVVPVQDRVPESSGDLSFRKALDYMGLHPGQPMLGTPVDIVFVGSCTNSRMTDLRQVAAMLNPSRRRPRRKGSTRSSLLPAPSGARRVARCAWV